MSNFNINNTKAYDEGYNDAQSYTNKNPYPVDSFEAKEYNKGFEYGLGEMSDSHEAYYGGDYE